MSEFSKGYDPREIETRWYERWMAAEAFKADAHSDKPGYTIVIPPPNVTGSLHMGHALTNTIQDVLIRWKRMSGFEALWLPGTDHAGIATQMVVERDLKKRGLDRREMGREAFLEHTWLWKEKYGNRISMQLRRLGSSLDWSRERFTMDEGLSKAVREVFVRLWEEGLIYQDDRLVNWDPAGQTVLSDLEVEQEEEDGFLWHIAYPVAGSEERLVVATTRPETLLGDTAVAVNPADPRYLHLHGKEIALPLTDRRIPIIADGEAASMEFGSGAVKITPAHDFNDFETGRRHNLPRIAVLDLDAKMNGNVPERFRGLDRFEARKRIVEELTELGLLVKAEPHKFMPARSQRTGVIVEPLSVGKQWYVKMGPLAEPAIAAVREGKITFVPEGWEKTYYHWMENIRDWCISRQLWWGHRIPAWTCGDCGTLSVSREDLHSCPKCGSASLRQDEDVLDTWFSSALWPFSTLGWPEKTPDLAKFYPTTVMETGFDIIFFWVARMIFMGLHFMGEAPFSTVFLHAMVRDKTGQKMSKTKGNVIDPLHIIDGVQLGELSPEDQQTYELLFRDYPEGVAAQGADALRFTLATYAAAGRDIKLDVKRVEGYKAFINKLWNASRFALMNLEGFDGRAVDFASPGLSAADKWIVTRLHHAAAKVETSLQAFDISGAAQAMYEFTWHELCDWYLELAKPVLYGDLGDEEARECSRAVLCYVLDQTCRLLHPFVPFVTEEVWSHLPTQRAEGALLCTSAWPVASEIPTFEAEAAEIALVAELITGIRRVRGESGVPASKLLPKVLLLSDSELVQRAAKAGAVYLRRMAKAESVEVVASNAERPSLAATTVMPLCEIVIPLEGVIDFEAEVIRLKKELAGVEVDIAFFVKKLSNERFVANAPVEVVETDRAKLRDAEGAKEKLLEGLRRLEGAV